MADPRYLSRAGADLALVVDDPPLTPEEEEAAIRWLEANPDYVAEVQAKITASFAQSSPFLAAFKKIRSVQDGR